MIELVSFGTQQVGISCIHYKDTKMLYIAWDLMYHSVAEYAQVLLITQLRFGTR
jgi:hypothetical protein